MHTFIFSAVRPCPHRPGSVSGRFANGHLAILKCRISPNTSRLVLGTKRGCYQTRKPTRCWNFSMIIDEKPTNEMVRRCIPPLRWRMEAAVSQEDHRHADSFGRHRLGQDDVSPRCVGRIGQGFGEEEVHAEAAAGVHGEHADLADRPRSLFWCPLSWSSLEATRP